MKVYILRGISGSGKSHYARQLLARHGHGAIVSADHYFMDYHGEYEFKPSELPKAHGQCLRAFYRYLTEAGPVDRVLIVDNTNCTAVECAPYVALAQAFGVDVEVVTLLCSPKKGHARQVHGVPISTVERQAWLIEAQAEHMPPWWNCRIR